MRADVDGSSDGLSQPCFSPHQCLVVQLHDGGTHGCFVLHRNVATDVIGEPVVTLGTSRGMRVRQVEAVRVIVEDEDAAVHDDGVLRSELVALEHRSLAICHGQEGVVPPEDFACPAVASLEGLP